MSKLFIALQHLLPQHTLSRIAGAFADSTNPGVKNTLIRQFAKHYQVDLSEAEINRIEDFASFNDFFTRALKPGARSVCESETSIASPVDGCISQLGPITDGTLVQAKGRNYSVQTLLGDRLSLAQDFNGGQFATIYLAPKDYHRIHMPISGELTRGQYVPGKLFSVNPATAQGVPNLFARNERYTAFFDSDAGPFAMVLVGAMIVASIETVWDGLVAPNKAKGVVETQYSGQDRITLAKGEEMGRFKLGSTVILLFPKGAVNWDKSLEEGSVLRMGRPIGSLC